MEEHELIRAFIAIELPAKIAQELEKIQDKLKDETNKITWVKPENIHLTIKFLGDIETNKIDSIAKVLEDAADNLSSFKISIKGVGAFPTIENPRVLWVGIEEDDTNVSQLYNNLEHGLTTLGFEKEQRAFKPHLTLGRIKFLKDKRTLKQHLEKVAGINLGKFEVGSFYLFKSKLTPEGAVHTKLKEVKLKKTGRRL